MIIRYMDPKSQKILSTCMGEFKGSFKGIYKGV